MINEQLSLIHDQNLVIIFLIKTAILIVLHHIAKCQIRKLIFRYTVCFDYYAT
uniref:Uncharacterized protein n=1 Tax=Setaria italica TaxID=4555 RepID=K3XP85_SETIT